MDVREKLVELMKEVKYSVFQNSTDHYTFGVQHSDHIFRQVADHLIANGVTVQEWKPISEPPKEKGTYLVCTDNGGVLLGHWYGTAWNAGGGAKKHLAYWMEKPQPPKGE